MDRSQRRELTQDMHRSAGSYELVLSPVVFAGLAFLVDRWLGTTPVLTIIAAVLGLAGAVTKLVYGYSAEMAEHDAAGPWSRSAPAEPPEAGS